MNELLQLLIYFFEAEALGQELQQLFEHPLHMTELANLNLPPSLDSVRKIFPWLGVYPPSNDKLSYYPLQQYKGTRVFNAEECALLSKKCRGFLLELERTGILTAALREQVLDEVMQLHPASVKLSRIKWIVLSVLCAQTDKTAAARMERIVFNIESHRLH